MIGADEILAVWWMLLGAWRAAFWVRMFPDDVNPLLLFLLIPLLPIEWALHLIQEDYGDEDEPDVYTMDDTPEDRQ